MSQVEYKIIGGPDRNSMIGSLRRWNEDRPAYITLKVVTDLNPGGRDYLVELSRIGLGSNDRHYENWVLMLESEYAELGTHRLEAYYNSSTRKGVIIPALR